MTILDDKFAPVRCVCGMTATSKVTFDRESRMFDVEVSCDHGGARRSKSERWVQGVRYAELTVLEFSARSGKIAPLGGSPLGDGARWEPAATAMQVMVGSNIVQATAGEKLSVGDLVSFDPRGRLVRAGVRELGTAAIVGAVVAGGSASGDLVRVKCDSNASIGPASAPPLKITLSRQPGLYDARNLAIGDIVQESTCASVLVAKVQKSTDRLKLTWRRFGDDAYKSIEVSASTNFRVAATLETTEGDPDRWYARVLAEEERDRIRQQVAEKAAPCADTLAKATGRPCVHGYSWMCPVARGAASAEEAWIPQRSRLRWRAARDRQASRHRVAGRRGRRRHRRAAGRRRLRQPGREHAPPRGRATHRLNSTPPRATV